MRKKRILWAVCIGFAVSLIVGGAVWLAGAVSEPLADDCTLLVRTGMGNEEIRLSIGANRTGWWLLNKVYATDTLAPGRYVLHKGDQLYRIHHRIRCRRQDPVMLRVPQTRFVHQLPAKLAQQLMADSTQIADCLLNSDLADSLGFSTATLPAMIIPDSYEVWWTITPKDLVMRLHREWNSYWNEERRALAAQLRLTPTEVATLASIVDSETANSGEKPKIAALYLNRLSKGMPLQADPTVIFAAQDFTIKRVLGQHLKIDSPYNTYRHKGLPPGPIRIASREALEAVLHHDPHPYLYMCAKEDFSGTHNFAATYAEHQANARRYVKALSERLK